MSQVQSEQLVLTKEALSASNGLTLDGSNQIALLKSSHGITCRDFGGDVAYTWKRVSMPIEGEDGYDLSKDYDAIQGVTRPEEIASGFEGYKRLALACAAVYTAITAERKPLVCNVQVGPVGLSYRHTPDGGVIAGGIAMPYGATEEVGLTAGYLYEEAGAIPLVIDGSGTPVCTLEPLARISMRENLFFNLTDGASHTFVLAVPLELERVYCSSNSLRGGQDVIILDFEAVNTAGETFTGKLYKYNTHVYGQSILNNMGYIKTLKLMFKASSQVVGFKPRFVLVNGVPVANSGEVPADAKAIASLQYIQLYALNNTKKGKTDVESGLVDITSLFTAAAGAQPAAKAGTSVADLLSASPTTGWEAAAVNQASNAFVFDLLNQQAPVKPRFVDVEFYTNPAYLGLTSAVLSSSYAGVTAEGVHSSNSQRFSLDTAATLDPAASATVRLWVHPNVNTQTAVTRLALTLVEGNATTAMKIKSVRIYA